MIKANELRIGNIINVIGLVPVVVTADHIKSIAEGDKDYSPIELAPKWLERCGFEKALYTDGVEYYQLDMTDYNNTHSQYHGSWKCYRVRQHNSDWYFEIHKDKSGHMPAYQEKKNHLHQLQNLCFALTGEELKIEL